MSETKGATQDPTKAGQEQMERATAAGKMYTAALSAATIAGLKTAFDLQNSVIAAGRTVVDAAIVANMKLADQTIHSVKAAQAEATKLVEVSGKLASESFEIRL